MKSSLSRILFICLVQLCIQQIKSQKQAIIILYDDFNQTGQQYRMTVKEGQCHSLRYGFAQKASSINTGGACVYVYDQFDCQGNWKQLSPMSNNHNDLLQYWYFDNQIASVQFCSNLPDADLPTIWRPGYFFDLNQQCYPARPNSNRNCLGFDSNAPLYYDRRQCNDTLRIQYWLFYGYQKKCAISNIREHDNDWEYVTFNFRRCDGTWCLSSITYGLEGGWYTRKFIGLVDIYAGRLGHGNYHNTCCDIGCQSKCVQFGCYKLGDWRMPGQAPWKPTNFKHIDNAVDDIRVRADIQSNQYNISDNDILRITNTIKNMRERDNCGRIMFKTCQEHCSANNADIF